MQESVSQIHWREFESWFSSEHADRMETLKTLDDSLEELNDTWKSQWSEDVSKQGVSANKSHGFIPLICYLLLNIYNKKVFLENVC